MSNDVKVLREKAEYAKMLYIGGQISREEALKDINPYIEAVNAKSKELAKKYNQKPKLVTASKFLRP